MEVDGSLFIMSQMLKTGAWIAAPILAACLITGLLVSIFQVVTQIQEMTLTFIPKLIVAVFILITCGSWMLSKWQVFAIDLISTIADL